MTTIKDALTQQGCDASLIDVIQRILSASKDISFRLQQGALAGVLGSTEDENVQGETQKKLDVISNDLLKDALKQSPYVHGIASEEEDFAVPGNDGGQYLVTYDPLDGSSNIDINVSVGTIFSIMNTTGNSDLGEDFLQAGSNQVAAGYVLYGPSSILVITTGQGVSMWTLDHTIGEYVLTNAKVQIPEQTKEFAINMSNQRFWAEPVQNYVADLLAGEEGPIGKRFNMRWVAAMVAEVHRILTRGGIFMYPWDSREPNKPGKLRLMYEGNPMAFLVEQAGGLCCTDKERMLDVQPTEIHQRVPVFLGSKEEVERAASYHNS
ncbi:class 1 fructose-bisphosphatase [Litoribrevibacter albus]|uniref:Fructose-1,6-bisphosphatase class 1 n=1 Tax=Litoribrevibacter albus TaxID=1473156 RepID=A0AA37W7G4_9GAMM|nr:class 1 fructose-bisphosphatase [Litoribrevibacter albus]GLQ31319.1 fructose-1,6-bisphosphatase class 1 [Litoribrevibacter albus]